MDEGPDVLFACGERDFRAPEILLRGVRGRMRAGSWWVRVEGADWEMRIGRCGWERGWERRGGRCL